MTYQTRFEGDRDEVVPQLAAVAQQVIREALAEDGAERSPIEVAKAAHTLAEEAWNKSGPRAVIMDWNRIHREVREYNFEMESERFRDEQEAFDQDAAELAAALEGRRAMLEGRRTER